MKTDFYYVVIDTEIEAQHGFKKAIITKFYEKENRPKEYCALWNCIDARQKCIDISERYMVVKIDIVEIISSRKIYQID